MKQLRHPIRRPLLMLAAGVLFPLAAVTAAWRLDKSRSANAMVTIIEAEEATPPGDWSRIEDPLARRGAYMLSGATGAGTELHFPIEVESPTEIAVTPVWFLHGEQQKARRFPDALAPCYVQQMWPASNVWQECAQQYSPLTFPVPVVAKPGPDAIAVLGQKAFFSAPVAGRIGIVDLTTETVLGHWDVGGYVSDIAVDAARGELLVADASGHRVVVFNAADGHRLAEVPVPAVPWSLALHGARLFVACLMAKQVAVVDIASRKIVQTVDLPVGPQRVAILDDKHPQLVVWLLPMAFDLKTLKEVPADRMTYWPSVRYGQPPEPAETQALAQAAAAFPAAYLTNFFFSRRPVGNILDAGPSLARMRSSYPPNAPPSKVYIAETGSTAVVVWDPTNAATVARIAVGEPPGAMELFDLKLCILCPQAQKVLVIDVASDQIVGTVPLPYPVQEFFVGALVPKYTTVEQLSPGPLISGEMPARIAVGFHPLGFNPQTLAPEPAPPLPFFPNPRRSEALSAGPEPKRLFVDNLHTIRINDARWIDTSPVTDYHLGMNPAVLRTGDVPGSITLRLDDGPECDWENDVWFTPDQRALLTRGTEEFDTWNAVRFTLAPGKHVLKVSAHGPYVMLDALKIRRTLAGSVAVRLQPLPESVHSNVPLPSYGGTFTASEPVSFRVRFANRSAQEQRLSCTWVARDYAGRIAVSGSASVPVRRGGTAEYPLSLPLQQPGRYTLRLQIRSAAGEHVVFHRFLKLAPLGYPRLLYRPEDIPQIRQRIAQYPVLFQRYADWLQRESTRPDFLPKTLRGSWAQDMSVENPKWRAICLAFADLFLYPGTTNAHAQLLAPLLSEPGGYNAWQGDYQFGGAHTILNDVMASASTTAQANIRVHYRKDGSYVSAREIQGFVFPDYLLAVQEPLADRDRAALFRIAMELNNYDAYFAAHAGSRGGNWFHDTTTWCRCPIHSMTRTFLWCRTFFHEPEFLERPHIAGMLTVQSYVYPRYDTDQFMWHGSIREPHDKVTNTVAMRWALSGLSRQPLEKTYYSDVFQWISTLNGPLPDEDRTVSAMLYQGGNVVIPLYLALGWLDPALQATAWEEMPPSILFDVEGAVAMKSGWDTNMTDIYFVSGVKDISYRNLPNHFHLFKAGQMVVGEAQQGDHANPVPFFGNCVRVGEKERFPGYMHMGWGYFRQAERWLADRRAVLGTTYMFRDWRLSGYRQEGTRWEGGGHPHAYVEETTLHSHTAHPFLEEGKIIAYETSPDFDYVLGDAANFWPLDEVQEAYRQFVFVRPDVVLVYDRLALGPTLRSTHWPLMVLRNKQTAQGNPALEGDVFTAANDVASLWGRVFLPVGAAIRSAGGNTGYLEVTPKENRRDVEYLVALRAGLATPAPLACTLTQDAARVHLAFEYEGRRYTVAFNRSGPVGGRIRIEGGGKPTIDRELARDIQDTYARWKDDPRFALWMKDERFRSYVPASDRARYGTP